MEGTADGLTEIEKKGKRRGFGDENKEGPDTSAGTPSACPEILLKKESGIQEKQKGSVIYAGGGVGGGARGVPSTPVRNPDGR